MTNVRRFVLCGHRGNMADAPENTLQSFTSAEHAGVDEIELDVRITLDGALVIIHDRTLARTAAVSTPHLHTPIEQLTLDEVRSFDLGNGQRTLTMDEALDATTVLLAVEIKAPAAARPLARLLQGRGEADHGRCLVTSFDPLSLSDFTDEWSGLRRGTALHVPVVESNWRDDARRLGVSTLIIPLPQLRGPLVDELHTAGFVVGASLIEGPGDVRRVLEMDVDTTASNAPAYARRLLEGHDEFKARFPSWERGGVRASAAVR